MHMHASKVACMHRQNQGSRCEIHLFLIPELVSVRMSIYTLHAYYFLLLLKLKNKTGLNLFWGLAPTQDNSSFNWNNSPTANFNTSDLFYWHGCNWEAHSPFLPGSLGSLEQRLRNSYATDLQRLFGSLSVKRCFWEMPNFHYCLCSPCRKEGPKNFILPDICKKLTETLSLIIPSSSFPLTSVRIQRICLSYGENKQYTFNKEPKREKVRGNCYVWHHSHWKTFNLFIFP